MKKKLIILLCSISLLFTGCNTSKKTYENNEKNLWDKFIIVKKDYNVNIGKLYTVYEKESKVMYYIWETAYKGSISPIYNSDGSVKVYKESEK